MSASPDIASGRLPAATLAENFLDIHLPLDAFEARVAAERCLYCYDAPCITACPTSIDIPLFIRQIANKNPIGSAKTILKQNIMGGMCARVCPTETLCEEACVRNAAEGHPVEIGLLQRYATDTLMDEGIQPFKRAASTGKKVAVVGAGPAGLSAAHRLSLLGHDVTIYEAREKAGGLNEFGIAAYKSTENFAEAEVEFILSLGGIAIEYGKRLGRDVKLTDLAAQYDAVFLGMGLGGTNALNLGEEPAGVLDAVDYIAALRQAEDLTTLPVGRRVVVIGGGMTAIDIASQIKRLGAEEVTIVYRRSQEQMNASEYEQALAQTDGVLIRTWGRPVKIFSDNGHLTGVDIEYTREEDGKLVGTGETYTIACDQLFKAIGQTFLAADLADAGLKMQSGRIVIDVDGKTSLSNVWAGGDCVHGGEDLTVAAVADGRDAAIAIDAAIRLTLGKAA